MTTLSVLQPSYLPWLGFFEQMKRADYFVLLDDVQYDKNGWRNRNRILTERGIEWLTIPALTKGKFGQTINEVQIKNDPWAEHHLAKIEGAYKGAPYFEEFYPALQNLLRHGWTHLVKIATESIALLRWYLNITTTMVSLSQLPIGGEKTDRLIALCEHFHADTYYSGAAAKAYLDVPKMRKAGIMVEWQDYQPKPYPQQFGDEFIEYLSAIDLIFNVGANAGAYV